MGTIFLPLRKKAWQQMAGPDKGSIFFMAFPAGNQSYSHRLKQVAGKALPAM